MTTPKPTPIPLALPISDRLRAIVDAHQAGYVALPPEISTVATIADKLKQAAASTSSAVAIAETRLRQVSEHAIEQLLSKGPTPAPEEPILDARLELDALVLRRTTLTTAVTQATRRTRAAFVRNAVPIADSLAAGLATVLELAAPDAPLLDGFAAWSDPAGVHELSDKAQDAWHRLDALAAEHDLLRQAAVGLSEELRIARSHALHGREDVALYATERFAGFGVAGPLSIRNNDPEWAWRPTRGEHPIARLLAAVAGATQTDPAADAAAAVGASA